MASKAIPINNQSQDFITRILDQFFFKAVPQDGGPIITISKRSENEAHTLSQAVKMEIPVLNSPRNHLHRGENRLSIHERPILIFTHKCPLKLGLGNSLMIALIRSFKLVLFMMRITIIGFGNQAKSWAQNLKDSGFPFRVALKPDSPSIDSVVKMGMESVEIGSPAFYEDRAFALLTPDHTHHDFMITYGHLIHEDSLILYAHGFSMTKHHFESHFSHLKHILYAPKSIGSELRRQYELKGKLGAVYSLEYLSGDTSGVEKWLFKLSTALGINMGPYKTSFKRETQADLYSEQGLLCSLIPYTANAMFNHLVESGVEPELAYFECWHELKLIVNAMVDKGPEGFYDLISPNALIGSEKGYERLFTAGFESNLKSLLTEIQDETFNKELEVTSVEDLRKTIRNRWSGSPLMKTFSKINQDH